MPLPNPRTPTIDATVVLVSCNFQTTEWISGPGSIEDLVTDAQRAGHTATVRLIRDWTEAGLLDYPQRRPAGKGHGSQRALYSANQRRLLLTMLHHRQEHRIRTLARIPVALWTYWGNEYVPTRQTARALRTWLGDARSSQKNARISAQRILGTLDHPDATADARQELRDALTNVAWTGRSDPDLQRKIRNVFEPDTVRIRRALGHPAAPLTTESMVDLIDTRLHARHAPERPRGRHRSGPRARPPTSPPIAGRVHQPSTADGHRRPQQQPRHVRPARPPQHDRHRLRRPTHRRWTHRGPPEVTRRR